MANRHANTVSYRRQLFHSSRQHAPQSQREINSPQVTARLEGETIWLREEQIANFFCCHGATVGHI